MNSQLLLPAVSSGTPQLDVIHSCSALELLRALPDNSIDCCVSSPPYFGLRSYLPDGHINKPAEIGLEPTPAEFVATMVTVFREVRRVLKASGTCWLNLGDSYVGGGGFYPDSPSNQLGSLSSRSVGNAGGRTQGAIKSIPGVASKNLLGIPWRVAFALQDDGWILRSDIIWHKPNPMPESVTDRPTKAHEYVFLLTKSPRYFYDGEAVRESSDSLNPDHPSYRQHATDGGEYTQQGHKWDIHGKGDGKRYAVRYLNPAGRNRRSVWTVATEPTPFAHFATFPRKLIEPMILAGCPTQVCAVCGAPYERVTEIGDPILHPDVYSSKGTIDSLGRPVAENSTLKHIRSHTTIGFEPTCKCDGATRPGVVLDMFGGSGTTGLVARSLDRHYILCDLNPDYVALARERLRQPFEAHHVIRNETLDDLPLFAQGATND